MTWALTRGQDRCRGRAGVASRLRALLIAVIALTILSQVPAPADGGGRIECRAGDAECYWAVLLTT